MRAKYIVLIILIIAFIVLVLIDRKIKLNKKKEQLEAQAGKEDGEIKSVSEYTETLLFYIYLIIFQTKYPFPICHTRHNSFPVCLYLFLPRQIHMRTPVFDPSATAQSDRERRDCCPL